MPNFKPVLFVIGIFLVVLAVTMLLPIILILWDGDPDAEAFLISSGISFSVGLPLTLWNRRSLKSPKFALVSRQMFLLTTLSWLSISIVSALPLMFSHFHLTFTDAFFETISGITTTGSTILVGLDDMPRGILLWRALMQWMGGIGIIVMAVAILPFLRVGGMRLFLTESSDKSDKPLPRAANVAKAISGIYLMLTVLCALAYRLTGMDEFEAVAHAMTTLATGGYSTSDNSMGNFSPSAHWVGTVFMLLGGLPFVLYVRLIHGDPRALLRNRQVHGFLFFLGLAVLILTVWLWRQEGVALMEALRLVAFNVTSVVTTTGYASTDYTLWGGFALITFFFLTFVGACSGSTSGGIKIFRFQIATVLLRQQLRKLVHPLSVHPARYNEYLITDDILQSLVGFSFFFAVTVALLAAALGLTGLDLLTSITGAATAVANVGPGLGDTIGPAGNFASLPDSAKWLLCLGMLLGRLEIMTVLVLFTPAFWRG